MNKKPFGKAVPPPPPLPEPRPAKPVPEVELRTKPRKRTLFKGRLVYGHDGVFTRDCVIADLSETGCRIEMESGAAVPEDVTLVHLREHMAFECKVAWRRDDGLGLKFTNVHDLRRADTPELKLLRSYCIEHNLR